MTWWRRLMIALGLTAPMPHRSLTELREETARVEEAIKGARDRNRDVAQDLTKRALDQIDRNSDVHATIQSMVGRLKAGNSALQAAEDAIALARRDFNRS